jgi:hypothetical protein
VHVAFVVLGAPAKHFGALFPFGKKERDALFLLVRVQDVGQDGLGVDQR